MPSSYPCCGTDHNLIYIDYLCTHVTPIRYDLNSTEFTESQPCASPTAGHQDDELCKLSALAPFNVTSLSASSITKHQ